MHEIQEFRSQEVKETLTLVFIQHFHFDQRSAGSIWSRTVVRKVLEAKEAFVTCLDGSREKYVKGKFERMEIPQHVHVAIRHSINGQHKMIPTVTLFTNIQILHKHMKTFNASILSSQEGNKENIYRRSEKM